MDLLITQSKLPWWLMPSKQLNKHLHNEENELTHELSHVSCYKIILQSIKSSSMHFKADVSDQRQAQCLL